MKVFRVGIVVDHGHLNRDVVFLAFHGDNILYERFPVPVEETDKLLKAFLGIKGFGNKFPFLIFLPPVCNGNLYPFVEIGQFSHSVGEGIIAVFYGLGKDIGIGVEGHHGAGLLRFAHTFYRVKAFAPSVLLFPYLAIPVYGGFQVV